MPTRSGTTVGRWTALSESSSISGVPSRASTSIPIPRFSVRAVPFAVRVRVGDSPINKGGEEMPDLMDGEVVEVQGSAKRPYQIKNLAGLYSCSCPAWRNQSLPIDRRSCKHIRSMRGDHAEAIRIGSPLASVPQAKVPKFVPPVL